MKRFLNVFTVVLVALFAFSGNLMAQDEEKGTFAFQVGGTSKIKNNFGVDSSRALFGASLSVSPFGNKTFYFGGSGLLNKSRRELVFFEEFPFQASSNSFLVDSVVGAKKKLWEGRFVPYVEGGVGFLGSRQSLCSGYLGCFNESSFEFSRHVSFGARTYLGEEKKFFVGAKGSFYKTSQNNLRVVLGEVGAIF